MKSSPHEGYQLITESHVPCVNKNPGLLQHPPVNTAVPAPTDDLSQVVCDAEYPAGGVAEEVVRGAVDGPPGSHQSSFVRRVLRQTREEGRVQLEGRRR